MRKRYRDDGRKTAIAICAIFIVMVFSVCGVTLAYTGPGEESGGTSPPIDEPPSPASYVVTNISINPGSATLYAGWSQQFHANATVLYQDDQDGNQTTIDITADVKWYATTGTIDSNGLYTATEMGPVKITAVYGSMYATATVDVIHGPIASVEITVKNATLATGTNISKNLSLGFGVRGIDAYGNRFHISQAYWTCNDTTNATIKQSGVLTFNNTDLLFSGEHDFNRSYLGLADAVNATGWINISGASTNDTDNVTVNGTTFTYNSTDNSGNKFTTRDDLISDINGADLGVTAMANGDHNITLTANTAGSAGNSITLSANGSIEISGSTLTGGADAETDYTFSITAHVSSNVSDTRTITIHANPGTNDDSITTSAVVDIDQLRLIAARTLKAIQVVALHGWDFGTVYEGTPTGWTEVVFKNIGTCNVSVMPVSPGGIYDYIEFKNESGVIESIGAFTLTLTTEPQYNGKGQVVNFDPESKRVETRINPPIGANMTVPPDAKIIYIVTVST